MLWQKGPSTQELRVVMHVLLFSMDGYYKDHNLLLVVRFMWRNKHQCNGYNNNSNLTQIVCNHFTNLSFQFCWEIICGGGGGGCYLWLGNGVERVLVCLYNFIGSLFFGRTYNLYVILSFWFSPLLWTTSMTSFLKNDTLCSEFIPFICGRTTWQHFDFFGI